MSEQDRVGDDGSASSAQVVAQMACLRQEVRQLRVACSAGIGLALVLVGLANVFDTERWSVIYSGIFVILGVSVILYPYLRSRQVK